MGSQLAVDNGFQGGFGARVALGVGLTFKLLNERPRPTGFRWTDGSPPPSRNSVLKRDNSEAGRDGDSVGRRAGQFGRELAGGGDGEYGNVSEVRSVS